MIVWLVLLTVALLLVGFLWRFARLDRAAVQIIASGLCLALAGYLWQGRPTLAGQQARPAAETDQTRVGGETFAALRKIILGQFDQGGFWLGMADRYLARGDSLNAVKILTSGVREHPRDPDLWIGLGNALFLHGGATITPSVDFAFDRAQQLAPGNPVPLFFRGMVYAQAADFPAAEEAWRRTLAGLPPETSWRPLVEERLQLVVQLRAMQQQAMQQQVMERAAPAAE